MIIHGYKLIRLMQVVLAILNNAGLQPLKSIVISTVAKLTGH